MKDTDFVIKVERPVKGQVKLQDLTCRTPTSLVLALVDDEEVTLTMPAGLETFYATPKRMREFAQQIVSLLTDAGY